MNAESTCPRCHLDDRVLRIGHVIDAGTSTTEAKSSTGILSTGGVGVARTTTTGRTKTALARRFDAPPQPKGGGRWALAIWVIVMFGGYFVFASHGKPDSDWPFYGTFAAATIVAIGFAVAWTIRSAPAVQAWQSGVRELRSGYYCSRDDVAFLPSDSRAWDPESFTRFRFTAFRAVQSSASGPTGNGRGTSTSDVQAGMTIPAGSKERVRILTDEQKAVLAQHPAETDTVAWLPDPMSPGTDRYWNGHEWTGRIRGHLAQ